MTTHSGRLWLLPDRDSKVRVDIYLDAERIRITSNEVVIGDWPISEVVVKEIGNNRVSLLLEGEEVVVSSRDPQFMPSVIQPLLDDASHADFQQKTSSRKGHLPSSGEEDSGPHSTSHWAALRSRIGLSRTSESTPR